MGKYINKHTRKIIIKEKKKYIYIYIYELKLTIFYINN